MKKTTKKNMTLKVALLSFKFYKVLKNINLIENIKMFPQIF